jgi:hypothetical protein
MAEARPKREMAAGVDPRRLGELIGKKMAGM